MPLEPAKKIISFFPNTNVASLTNIPREKSLQIYKQLEKMHQKEYSALSKTIFELRHTMSQQSGQHFKLTNKIERMPFEDLMQIMIAVNLSKK